MADDSGGFIYRLFHSHYETAATAAATSVIGLVIYSWFKKIPYGLFLQSAAICIFMAIILDVLLLEWLKLPQVACLAVGVVSGFAGRPLIMKWVGGADDAFAGKVADRVNKAVD